MVEDKTTKQQFIGFKCNPTRVIQLEGPVVWEECTSNFSGWPKSLKKAYFTAVFLIIFVIPLVIMFCLYTHILVQLRDKARDNKRVRMLEMEEHPQVISSLKA